MLFRSSKQAAGFQFPEPGGQAGEAEHYHKDKGADDLDLVFSRPADRGIESGKVFHNRIQVQYRKYVKNPLKSGGEKNGVYWKPGVFKGCEFPRVLAKKMEVLSHGKSEPFTL